MDDILREPVELIDQDLDEVAGGNFDQSGVAVALAQSYKNFGQTAVDVTAIASVVTIG